MKATSEEMCGKSTQGTQCRKVHFSGFQRYRRQYGFIFIRLAVVASEIHSAKFSENSNFMVMHPRSSILVLIKSSCDFLLVIHGNYGRTVYLLPFSRYWRI